MRILLKMKIFYSVILTLLLVSPTVLAHEGIDDVIRSNSIMYLLIAASITLFFVIYAIEAQHHSGFTNKKKLILFLGIVIPVITTTAYLVTATIYLNSISTSGGPVHWHADFEIYGCYDKINLISPKGLSNRVGTSVFHTHGDNRIHVEGVVENPQDISLHNFFDVVGGSLTKDELIVPADKYVVKFHNRDRCDGGPGMVQVFAYTTKDGKAIQKKVDENYILSPYTNVPPGDCIIVEFSPEKTTTKHMCETYRIAIEKGDLSYGG